MAKKAKSSLINMLLSLTLIALAAALALALVNNATKGPIEEVKKQQVADAIAEVLPKGQEYTLATDTVVVNTEKGDIETVCYTATTADGALVGKAVRSYDNNGFGGRLTAMVGFDAEGNITGYKILESAETPGLGAKADKWFQPVDKEGNPDLESKHTVIGKNPATANLTVSKDKGEIDAITGSTITSRAFCRLVAAAYQSFTNEKGDNE